MPSLRPLVVTAAAVLALPAGSAAAATVPDVPVGMTDRSEVAVHGTTVAYLAAGAADRVVLRRPQGPDRTFAKVGGVEGLTLGHDARGRLVLVYPTCATAASRRGCRLRRVDVATGRSAFVRGVGPGRISRPVLRRGMLAWLDAGRVMARPLAGGRAARQDRGRERIDITGLDHDGRRFAITGALEGDGVGGGATEVRAGRLGRRGTKALGRLNYAMEYRGFHTPMFEGDSVVVVDEYDPGLFNAIGSSAVIRYPLDGGRRRSRVLDVPFTAMAQGGGRMAFVQAPSLQGCASELGWNPEEDEEPRVVGVPCRVVLAGALPLGRATRRGLPSVSLAAAGRRLSGRVVRTIVPPHGQRSRNEPVAGATVRLVDVDERSGFAPSGLDVTTDAAGRFTTVLPKGTPPRRIGAVLVGPFPAFAPAVREVPPAPAPEW